MELQELLDKANKDLSASRERSNTLNTRVAELESELANVRKELLKSEEFSAKHQRDIREVGVSHTPHFSARQFEAVVVSFCIFNVHILSEKMHEVYLKSFFS